MLHRPRMHWLTDSSVAHVILVVALAIILFFLLFTRTAQSQAVSDSDFIELGEVTAPLNAVARVELPISIRTRTPAMALTVPLSYGGHPALHVDLSVGDQGVTFDSIGNYPPFILQTSYVDTAAKTILIGLISFSDPLPPSDGPLATLNFITDPTTQIGSVVVDTVPLPPSNRLTLVDVGANDWVMQYTPGMVRFFEVGPTLQLDPDRLDFAGFTDSTVPPAQTFALRNVGTGSIHWTATPNEPWISVDPVSGTGETTLTVRIHSVGMAAGHYTGFVVVEDSGAVNSPQKVRVDLELDRRANPADSNYVVVERVVVPLGHPSRADVGVWMGSTSDLAAVVVPLSYAGTPHVGIDTTAGEGGLTYEELGTDPRWSIRPFVVDPDSQTVVLAFISFTHFKPSEGPLATLHFFVDSTDTVAEIPLDSTFVPPANSLLFQSQIGHPIVPAFTPGAIVISDDLGNLGDICLTPDSVYLEAPAFSEILPCASVLLQNCGWDGALDWTASVSCDWLSVSPDNGLDDSVYLNLCATTTDGPGRRVCTVTVSTHTFPPITAQTVVYYQLTAPGGSGPPPFTAEIQASIAAKVHDAARLGTAAVATDGYDPGVDMFEPPPPPGNYVRVYFPHPEWGQYQSEFDVDIRQWFGEGCRDWTMVVETAAAGPVHLHGGPRWFGPCPFPCPDPGIGLILLDTDGRVLTPNLQTRGYSYESDGGTDTFLVRACYDVIAEYTYPGGWSLISTPIEPRSPSLPSIFGDGHELLQVYEWMGGYRRPYSIHGCGQGYWLYAPDSATAHYQGTLCNLGADQPTCFPLGYGWNIIGNPLHGPILPAAQVKIDSGGVMLSLSAAAGRGWVSQVFWGWDNGSYYDNRPLMPFQAYWFGTMLRDLEMCIYPGMDSLSSPMMMPEALGAELVLHIAGQREQVRIGVREDATAGYDGAWDRPAAPDGPAGAGLRLVINSSLHEAFAHWARDVRGPADVIEWPVRIMGEGTEPVALEIDNTQALIDIGYELFVREPKSQELTPLTSDGQIVATGRQISIVADRGASEGTLPDQFYLAANYPNPFNPGTSIQFGLPLDARVQIAIYNILGQQVRRLEDAQYTAGEYELYWDGTDNQGRTMSSGVYFYRLSTGDYTQTRKMMMLK